MARKIKMYNHKSWLYRKYVKENKTAAEIAKICGVTEMTISRKLQEFGLQNNARSYWRN